MKQYLLVGLCGALVVAACGGGGSLTAGIDGRGNPNPSAVVSKGTITGFGSIIVNGIQFDTGSATFGIDGRGGAQSDLAVGHVVVVKGTINEDGTSPVADSVTFDDSVEGPISAIDVLTQTITVLGQMVRINADTSFDDSLSPASIDGLSIGLIVEVSGQFDANGDISATRIEPKPAGSEFEVHGTVSGHDGATFVFSLNNLVVDYSNATINDFPGGVISDGDFVEAKGVSLGAGGELIATLVEFEDDLITGDDGTYVEIEGFITRFASSTDFDVSGNPVTTTAGTNFVGGVAADLGLNVKVEVEGDLDANGLLVADKVDIRRSKAVRSTAIVDSVDAPNGSLVMLGITFTTDELTRFEDKSDLDIRSLTINDINVGDYLEIRGAEFPSGSGQVLATILEREDVDSRTELQGFVESISDPSLTILGVSIDTSGAIFRDVDDSILTSTEFFNMVGVNSLIKATGTESGDTSILATEVEFELEL